LARDYARWQCEYNRVRPDPSRLRLPEVLDEKPKAWMTRSLLKEEGGSGAASGEEAGEQQPKSERLQHEITELRAKIAEVEAATEKELAAVPEAALRRHAMREAERARIQHELEALQRRKAAAGEALETLLAARAAEEERGRQACQELECQVHPLCASLEEQRSEIQRLQGQRSQQEAQTAAEEAEISRLQTHVDNLRKEIVAADFRRDKADAEVALRRQVHRWGMLCSAFLWQEQEKAWRLEVEEFEAAVRESEVAAGLEAPVSPRADGFYLQVPPPAA